MKKQDPNIIIGDTARKAAAKSAKYDAFYREYKAAVDAGSYVSDVQRALMPKYGIKSLETVYRILRKQRAKEQQESTFKHTQQ